MRRFCLLFVIVLMASQSWATTILVLGDSISAAYGMESSQGWVALLDRKLQHNGDYSVINASVSGETSAGGVHRLDQLLSDYQPDWVIIELGGNDGLRGYPLKQLRQNLARMIEDAIASNATVMLLGMQIPPNYGQRYSQQFAAIYPELAEEFEVLLLAKFLAPLVEGDGLIQADGIHPTVDAQPLLMQQVYDVLMSIDQP